MFSVSYWIAAEVTFSAEIQEASSLEYPSHKIKYSIFPYIIQDNMLAIHIHSTINFSTLHLLVDITLSTKKQSEGNSSPVWFVGSLRFEISVLAAELEFAETDCALSIRAR